MILCTLICCCSHSVSSVDFVVELMHLWDSNYHGQVSNQGIAYGGKHIVNQYTASMKIIVYKYFFADVHHEMLRCSYQTIE